MKIIILSLYNIFMIVYVDLFYFSDQKLSRLKAKLEPSQEIVPQQLIDHFVSMSDPSNASFTEIDLAHHCAFSLPAVALTLGPNNWDLLKDTYTALAFDKKVCIFIIMLVYFLPMKCIYIYTKLCCVIFCTSL